MNWTIRLGATPGGTEMIRVALAGYGYWGPKLARNIAQSPHCALAAVCDPSARRLVLARRAHPAVHLTTD
jgi:predicted dehydrogenase